MQQATQQQTQQDHVDVQQFIDRQPFTPFQWRIFALCFIIVLLDGFDTAAIGYIAPSLIQQFGVSKSALAPVLSAALFGLAAGALLSGPLADKLGRKRVLIGAVLVFGVFSMACAFSNDLQMLAVLRFATGIGLGAAMPNAVTLVSEYCPSRWRSMLTNAMFCGFPLGSAFGGFVAAWMIPQWGWHSVLLIGGIVPLLLLIGLLVWLPESVRFMVAKHYPHARIQSVLGRIHSSAAQAKAFFLTETKASVAGKDGLAVVLSPSYRVGSLMLWLTYFMGLVIFYALINWIPVLFKEAGLDPKTSMLLAALFPLGGVGAIACGWLMDRFNANRMVAFGYAGTAVMIFMIGQVTGHMWLLVPTILIAGALMNTAQSSMPALAASFYPTQGRATGVAWMLGIGRFGGIAGTFLVAELQRQQLGLPMIFTVVAIPALCAVAALTIKQWAHPEQSRNNTSAVSAVSAH